MIHPIDTSRPCCTYIHTFALLVHTLDTTPFALRYLVLPVTRRKKIRARSRGSGALSRAKSSGHPLYGTCSAKRDVARFHVYQILSPAVGGL